MDRLAAGRRMRDLRLAMAGAGASPASLLLGRSATVPHRHYPDGDVYDFTSHAQFYCHIHRHGEFGHIHVFQRPRGMPAGLTPLVPPDEANAPCHLVAVGFGSCGDPVELFTTNRWVTGEAWYDAAAVKAMLRRFRIAARDGLAPVAAWLEAVVAFYLPVIETLVDERDAAVAEWSRRHPRADPLNDAALEITSRRAVDPVADLAVLEAGA